MSRRLCADTVGIGGGWWTGLAIPHAGVSLSRAQVRWSRALLYCRTVHAHRALSLRFVSVVSLVMRGSCVPAVCACVGVARTTPLPALSLSLSRVLCSGDKVQSVNCVTVLPPLSFSLVLTLLYSSLLSVIRPVESSILLFTSSLRYTLHRILLHS